MRVAATSLLLAFLWAPAVQAADLPVPGHRVRLLRSWDDTVKERGHDVARKVELLFDYTDAVAIERVLDAHGTLLSSRILEGAPPRPSPEEFQEAVDLVKADAEIGEIASRTGGIFEGGFLLEGGQAPCGAGTRCIEVQILSRDRYAAIRKVVVDLVAQRIAIRAAYPPPLGAPEEPAAAGEVAR